MKPKYVFEQEAGVHRMHASHRDEQSASTEVATFRARLGIQNNRKMDDEAAELLLRYCTDVVLNVLWYDRAREKVAQRNKALTWLMVALMCVALGLMMYVGLTNVNEKGGDSHAAYSLTLLAGGALTVLQVLATLADGKSRLGIFWKAGADLKDKLYSFEREWHGKVFDDDKATSVSAAFAKAMAEDLRSARVITRAERVEFFATVKSPSDVLAVAIAAADALRTRRTDALQASSAREQRMVDAKKAAAEAHANVEAAKYRLAHFPDDSAEKKAEALVLVRAEADVLRTNRLLDEASS